MLKDIYRWINPKVEIKPFEKNKCQVFHNGKINRTVGRRTIADEIRSRMSSDFAHFLILGIIPLITVAGAINRGLLELNETTTIAEGIFAIAMFVNLRRMTINVNEIEALQKSKL